MSQEVIENIESKPVYIHIERRVHETTVVEDIQATSQEPPRQNFQQRTETIFDVYMLNESKSENGGLKFENFTVGKTVFLWGSRLYKVTAISQLERIVKLTPLAAIVIKARPKGT